MDMRNTLRTISSNRQKKLAVGIFYGIEAGNQEVLDTIKKGMTKKKLQRQ